MLARSGRIPTRGDWVYEVKWDGFRAIVSTEREPLRVRSRRGWDMTPLLPKLFPRCRLRAPVVILKLTNLKGDLDFVPLGFAPESAAVLAAALMEAQNGASGRESGAVD